jgi:hypothetical protein
VRLPWARSEDDCETLVGLRVCSYLLEVIESFFQLILSFQHFWSDLIHPKTGRLSTVVSLELNWRNWSFEHAFFRLSRNIFSMPSFLASERSLFVTFSGFFLV